jgi:hypothetical protein
VTPRRIAGLAAAAALLLLAGSPGSADEGPACAECHEEEAAQWKASGHSRAMKPEFLAEWTKQGRKWECLACHTSTHDRGKGTFSLDGVGCASCHGPADPGHPDGKKMEVRTGSESCRECHGLTYAEWRVSAHGQKDVGCMSCHRMHAMELRKEDPDQMCGSCHTERLQDFAHATHKEKGLHCISCHMPDTNGSHLKIKGTGARGHSYGVGAETCAGCHRVQVHQSGEIAELKSEVTALKVETSKENTARIPILEKENGRLKATLEANHRFAPWVAVVGFLLGGLAGFSVSRLASRGTDRVPRER